MVLLDKSTLSMATNRALWSTSMRGMTLKYLSEITYMWTWPSIGMVSLRKRFFLPLETKLSTSGLLQRGTPQMDGVPGVTQVRSLYTFTGIPEQYVAYASVLVSHPSGRRLHLPLLHRKPVWLLLVPYPCTGLLWRWNPRTTDDTPVPIASSSFREPCLEQGRTQ